MHSRKSYIPKPSAFAKRMLKTALSPLSEAWYQKIFYRIEIGRFPDLDDPKRYSEKIIWSILYDRAAPKFHLADKLKTRNYLIAQGFEEYLPVLYFKGPEPALIPFDQLPSAFVVKPNHGSGWVKLVLDKQAIDERELKATCRKWLSKNFYWSSREPQYRSIQPIIMIEEFVGGGPTPPTEHKVLCFGGEPRVICHFTGRFTPGYGVTWFDTDWVPLAQVRGHPPVKDLTPPNTLPQILELARRVSASFDFVSVDLMEADGQLKIGELTFTPLAGRFHLEPDTADALIGSFWQLPAVRIAR